MQQTQRREPSYGTPRSETNGKTDGIPHLGEFQVDSHKFVAESTSFAALVKFLRSHLLYVYAAALVVTAACMAGTITLTSQSWGAPAWAIVGLAALAYLAERQPVRVSANLEMTVAVLPTLFAAVVFGPVAAMAVAAIGLVAEFRRPYIRWAVWTALRVITAGLAGLTASAVLVGDDSLARLTVAIAAAVVVEASADFGLGVLTVAVRQSGPWRECARSLRTISLATVPLYTSTLVLLAYAYREVSAWSVILFFGPAFVAHMLYRLYRREQDASHQLRAAYARLERANLSFATALVTTLDARDRYTAGHSAAVAIYARDIARRLGLPEADQQLAHLCGLVHDIGKIGLPPGLLEKPGPLTLDERRQMERHAEIGERILAKVEDYSEIAKIVRHHHERVDGHGYPDGIDGQEIPLISRIIAVADAYDAMTSDRPYRDAMPSSVARLRLAQAVESQFDTTVVAAFEAVLVGSSDAYRLGAQVHFSLEARGHQALQVAVA
jgi:putative nucleotidyltransferase with HDIG domain